LNDFRALAHRASAAVKAPLAGEAMAVPLVTAEQTVRTVIAAFLGLPPDGKEPAYEILRRQVQVQLALREELAV
jgi:hypothetical protein